MHSKSNKEQKINRLGVHYFLQPCIIHCEKRAPALRKLNYSPRKHQSRAGQTKAEFDIVLLIKQVKDKVSLLKARRVDY
jgi:hypothetical protein